MGWFSELSAAVVEFTRTVLGYRIPIKFDLSYKYFDNYIRISDITNTKLGRKIHKRKSVVSKDGVWFLKAMGILTTILRALMGHAISSQYAC